jgi:hypothetical protein
MSAFHATSVGQAVHSGSHGASRSPRRNDHAHLGESHARRRGAPAGKLADVELHFAGGELDGLRLIGFAVWARRDGGGKNVTFPARQFTVRGERRSYTLLRSIENVEAEKRLREFVLQAYAGYDNEPAATVAR